MCGLGSRALRSNRTAGIEEVASVSGGLLRSCRFVGSFLSSDRGYGCYSQYGRHNQRLERCCQWFHMDSLCRSFVPIVRLRTTVCPPVEQFGCEGSAKKREGLVRTRFSGARVLKRPMSLG